MSKLNFRASALFVEDMNRLASLDRTIIDEVHAAVDLLCELHELPDEFSDHALEQAHIIACLMGMDAQIKQKRSFFCLGNFFLFTSILLICA